MGPLLVVLVVGCAVAVAARVGRGIWARARTVERHHQALESLADITQGPDGGPHGRGEIPTGAHQAHVRIIGAPTIAQVPALPPPRPLVGAPKGRSSPFRRPSRHSPSLAALDAVATARTFRAPVHGQGRQRASRAEGLEAPLGPGPDSDDRTLPGVPPPAVPVPAAQQATRPVPVPGPQVFYFDDLGARSKQPGPPPDVPSLSALAGTVARARSDSPGKPAPGQPTVASAGPGAPQLPGEPVQGTGWPSATMFDDTVHDGDTVLDDDTVLDGDTVLDDTVPGHTAPLPPGHRPQRDSAAGHGRLGRKSVVASLLAAAAIVVALAAVALTIFNGGLNGGPGPQTKQAGPPATRLRPQTSAAAPRSGPTSSAPPTSAPPTSAPPRTAPSRPAPPRPAALVSTASGTATYHLGSRSASIVVSARGACWLEVRAGSPSGQVIYEGTLEAGQRSSITGPAWIRIGDPPKVTVLVNGMRLGPPGAEEAVPLNLQFTVAGTD